MSKAIVDIYKQLLQKDIKKKEEIPIHIRKEVVSLLKQEQEQVK